MLTKKLISLLCLTTLTCCTQAPAPVEQLGETFFGTEQRITSTDNSEAMEAESFIPAIKTKAKHKPEPEVVVEEDLDEDEGIVAQPEKDPVPKKATNEFKIVTPQDIKPTPAIAQKFIWPAEGEIVKPFSAEPGIAKNDGINIALAEDTPIKASADGVVIYSGDKIKKLGNLTIVKHENGLLSVYGNQKELLVSKGDIVKQGQVIGSVGHTGDVTSSQLHFAIREGKTPVDPTRYLLP